MRVYKIDTLAKQGGDELCASPSDVIKLKVRQGDSH